MFAICSANISFTKDYLASFDLSKVSHSEEASLVFWNWLLQYTQLTPQSAAVYKIFEDGSTAVFYDLDDDGVREIIGTHYSTDIMHRESCYLYILKYDASSSSKYTLISDDLYFDVRKPLFILNEKNGGFHVIRAKSQRTGKNKFFAFDKEKGIYLKR